MKQFISIIVLIFIATTTSLAQSHIKKDTIEVDGNCDMCKKRIENAAYIKGVKRADWDKKDKKLVVVYNDSKTTLEKIEQSVAKAGHNTVHVEATEASYKKLPNCCQYKTEVCEH